MRDGTRAEWSNIHHDSQCLMIRANPRHVLPFGRKWKIFLNSRKHLGPHGVTEWMGVSWKRNLIFSPHTSKKQNQGESYQGYCKAKIEIHCKTFHRWISSKKHCLLFMIYSYRDVQCKINKMITPNSLHNELFPGTWINNCKNCNFPKLKCKSRKVFFNCLFSSAIKSNLKAENVCRKYGSALNR